jgi:hypothetical protein
MIDGFDRVDNFVVPTAANMQEIIELWKRTLEIPDEIEVVARSGNGQEIFWGFKSAASVIPCILRTLNMHGDAQIRSNWQNSQRQSSTNRPMPSHTKRERRRNYCL